MEAETQGKRLPFIGDFLARATAFGLHKAKNSQSIAIRILFQIESCWPEDGKTAEDWFPPSEPYYIFSDQYIVGRDGQSLDGALKNISKCFGVSDLNDFRDPEKIENLPEVRLTVNEEEYKDQTRIKVQWINPGDSIPGKVSVGNVSESEWDRIEDLIGAKFTAQAGAQNAA